MRSLFVLVVVAIVAASTISAGSLPYTTDGSVSTSASVNYGFYINDLVGGGFSSDGYNGTTSIKVAFTINLILPTVSNYILNSASITFSGDSSTGAASITSVSSGSQGSSTCRWVCGSDPYTAANASFDGSNGAVLTGISDGSTSKTVNYAGGSLLDLLQLGFGNDLLAGGVLQLTGYRWVNSELSNISSDGFNAHTDFGVSYDGGGQEYARLDLAGRDSVVPEPRRGAVLLAALMAISEVIRRKRHAEQKS